jgi:uncharacterized protein YndB with AHSA1/START domain
MSTKITVSAEINAPIEKVWNAWTNPTNIMQWCNASDDWHAPKAENDLRVGGKFSTTMAAKDGSFSFDFEGEYTKVDHHQKIDYSLGDGRTVDITFNSNGNTTSIIETFDAESENPIEMQQGGWQAILNNFKKHVEAL